MRLELMIEGQEDVTWAAVGRARAGLRAARRGARSSARITTSRSGGETRGSLETWTTLAGLAAITTRLRFGVLVSPATFRHPSVLAKAVAAVDHISGGRVDFGLGAGWNEREHEAYGFEFPPLGTRLELLEEQLEVVCGALGRRTVLVRGRRTTAGRPRRAAQAGAAPAPADHHRRRREAAHRAHGGPFRRRVQHRLRDPGRCAERRAVCEAAWTDAGRDPATLTFSVMIPWCGETASRRAERLRLAAVDRRVGRVGIFGTLDEAVARLRRLSRRRRRSRHAPAPAARRRRRDRRDPPPLGGAARHVSAELTRRREAAAPSTAARSRHSGT